MGAQLDETELEEELDQLQQQELDDKMLETGTVPVDNIQRQQLPAVANGESKLMRHAGLATSLLGRWARLTVS